MNDRYAAVLDQLSRGPGASIPASCGGDAELVFDEPVIINCYTSDELIEEQADQLRTFLMEMGTDLRQGAVGIVIDRDYLEIAFPLEDETDG